MWCLMVLVTSMRRMYFFVFIFWIWVCKLFFLGFLFYVFFYFMFFFILCLLWWLVTLSRTRARFGSLAIIARNNFYFYYYFTFPATMLRPPASAPPASSSSCAAPPASCLDVVLRPAFSFCVLQNVLVILVLDMCVYSFKKLHTIIGL